MGNSVSSTDLSSFSLMGNSVEAVKKILSVEEKRRTLLNEYTEADPKAELV